MDIILRQKPSIREVADVLPFYQYFTDTGLQSGNKNLSVNGETVQKEFSIKATTKDIYIKNISIVITDINLELSKFGGISSLNNVIVIEWESNTKKIKLFPTIKTNFDLIRHSIQESWKDIKNIYSGIDGYLIKIDFSILCNLQWGLKLVHESDDSLKFKIRDNLESIEEFNVIGYGIVF